MGSSDTKAFERWNTHFSTCVEQEVLGVNLRLAQDPNSEHLGTTVWDASIVLAKYLEKNMRKGEFSRPKVSGKRAIELGAGMGLAGIAFALIGADVLLTDVKEVLPLLQRNYENNVSPAALRASGQEGHVTSCGRVSVAELDWSQPQQYAALAPPPFDYVLAADCIYHETLLRQLYRVMLAITSERSTVIVANEKRSESVQSAFTSLFSSSFTMKKVPLSKQDPDYCHPAIELYVLKKKKGASDAWLRELEEREAADLAEVASSMQQLAASPPAEQQQQQQQDNVAQYEQQQQPCQECEQETQQEQQQEGKALSIEQQRQKQQQQQQQQQAGSQPVQEDDQQRSSDDTETRAAAGVVQEEQQQSEQEHAPGVSSADSSCPSSQLTWHTRRQGAEAARLLAGVKVP